MAKCPYCGKELFETERYCWHCEHDVSKAIDKDEKPAIPSPVKIDFKKISADFNKLKKKVKKIMK